MKMRIKPKTLKCYPSTLQPMHDIFMLELRYLYKHRTQIKMYCLESCIFGKYPCSPNIKLNPNLFTCGHTCIVLLSTIGFILIMLYSSCNYILKMYDLTERTHLTVFCWCLYWVTQGQGNVDLVVFFI